MTLHVPYSPDLPDLISYLLPFTESSLATSNLLWLLLLVHPGILWSEDLCPYCCLRRDMSSLDICSANSLTSFKSLLNFSLLNKNYPEYSIYIICIKGKCVLRKKMETIIIYKTAI